MKEKINELNSRLEESNNTFILENDTFKKKLSQKDKEKVNNGYMVIKLTSGDLAKLRTPDGAEISKDMYNSVVTYKTLMDGLYQRLRNGVTAQIDGIASRVEMQRGTLSPEALKQLKKNLE